ncbi:UNKNOWN [Stylonychia lemnae]|uniref:Uncharacterized protein n=1 Tax=Stylonychia lemnae TaxID=5949 RepID=A0A077ZV59_STYLE|nr:UNKNOWN [Stylonychia lemnae]|eukprot:CDW73185.1 UNKNOWN [Stylonychia lemnae]
MLAFYSLKWHTYLSSPTNTTIIVCIQIFFLVQLNKLSEFICHLEHACEFTNVKERQKLLNRISKSSPDNLSTDIHETYKSPFVLVNHTHIDSQYSF